LSEGKRVELSEQFSQKLQLPNQMAIGHNNFSATHIYFFKNHSSTKHTLYIACVVGSNYIMNQASIAKEQGGSYILYTPKLRDSTLII